MSETIHNEEGTYSDEAIDFFLTLSAEEHRNVNEYLKGKEGSVVTLADLETAKRNTPKPKTESQNLASLSIQEKEKQLEALGLFKDPRKHFHQGKAYPTNDPLLSNRAKGNDILRHSQKVETTKRVVPDISRGQSRVPYKGLSDYKENMGNHPHGFSKKLFEV